jgi:hypothetical protein
MIPHAGKLYFILIVALLSCVAARIIARLYRRRMRQLMRTPHTGESQAPVAEAAPDGPPPLAVSLADNRSAGRRLTLLLIASSCLISLTSSCIWWALRFPGEPLTPKGVASRRSNYRERWRSAILYCSHNNNALGIRRGFAALHPRHYAVGRFAGSRVA